MIEDIQNRLKIWESYIILGQGLKVRQELSKLNINRVPRSGLVKVANIARRISMPELSLKVLNSIVRPAFGKSDATDNERAEYAAALSALGAQGEARELLKGINGESCPDALLFYAFSQIFQWNYHEAIAPLQKYIAIESSSYKKMVGKINLCSAYLFIEENEKALSLASQVFDFSMRENMNMLAGNCLELKARAYFAQGNFKKANELLLQSEKMLRSSENVSYLFSRKWLAILQMHQTKNSNLIDKTRRDALDQGEWETVRDLDFRKGLFEDDLKLLRKVYFGTPYNSYRDYVASKSHVSLNENKEYFLNYSDSGKSHSLCIDVGSGSYSQVKNQSLKAAQLPLRLFQILCSDFYRPFLIGSLFSQLYPNEYFNPTSSPDRVYRVVRRLRDWFSDNQLPIAVIQKNQSYKIKLTGPASLKINIAVIQKDFRQTQSIQMIDHLQNEYGPHLFSAKQASKVLELPLRTTNRLLKETLETGELEKVGGGPHTKYKLTGS